MSKIISQHEAEEYGRKEYLAKRLKRAKADAHYFDSVYEAVLSGRNTVVTKMPHPTGMLYTPYGYQRLTGMYCVNFGDEYIQQLEAGMADMVRECANVMQAAIWMPVADVSKWETKDAKSYKKYLSEYETAYQNGDIKRLEHVAKKMLVLFMMTGIIPYGDEEVDYEQTRFI